MASDPLFDDVTVDDLHLDNRLALAPMTRTSATDDSEATAQMRDYYAKFALGGFSPLVTEGVYPDTAHSQGYDNQPGLATDAQAESWKPVVDAVHEEDSAVLAQLMHAGALSQGSRYADETVGPSAVTPKGEQLPIYGSEGEFQTPQALDVDELDEIRADFVAAAERAVDAGFDGVEVHGANDYLLDQFLTEYTNERGDEYGGSVANRVRFPVAVVESVVAATPEDFVVGVRVSQTKVNDDEHEWADEEQAAVVFGAFTDAGADYVHVTEPDVREPAIGDAGPTLSDLAAEHAAVPVITNGTLGDPEDACEAVDAGADLVAQATSALANPDWPDRVAADEPLADFDFEATLLPTAEIGDAEVPAAAPADD